MSETAIKPGFDFRNRNIKIVDTSIRDGGQDSGIIPATISQKERFINMLPTVGVDVVDIGMPCAGQWHINDITRLSKLLPSKTGITCLSRTLIEDIEATLRFQEGAGRQIETIIFVGISPRRIEVEGWDRDQMLRNMDESVNYAVKRGLIANVATEHTTEGVYASDESREFVKKMYQTGLAAGGTRIAIADTTGSGDPFSVEQIFQYFRSDVIADFNVDEIDFHGHNDLGQAVSNSLAALRGGATRIHTTTLGLGERSGNTPMETFLVNLKKYGDPRHADLKNVQKFAEHSSQIFNRAIPVDSPGIGEKVFSTASGIHASAMTKARTMGYEPGSVYSSANPEDLGRKSEVYVGPLSGNANVIWVCDRLGIEPNSDFIALVKESAKSTNKVLTDSDIFNLRDNYLRNGASHHASTGDRII